MSKTASQKGIAHILLIVVLLLGLGFGLYLLNQQTHLFSKAASGPVSGPVNIPVTSTPAPAPSTGGGVINIPIIGPVEIPEIFPTQAPVVPTATPVPTFQGCADSVGNGANGVKCENYLGTDKNKCPNNVYPYLYSTCRASGAQVTQCPQGSTAVLINGVINCTNNVTPTVTVNTNVRNLGQGCADSAGNGGNGITCTGYLRYDTSTCPNNVYPYIYSSCTQIIGSEVTPTTAFASSNCGDSSGRGQNGKQCSGYLRYDTNACPNNVYPYVYSSCNN